MERRGARLGWGWLEFRVGGDFFAVDFGIWFPFVAAVCYAVVYRDCRAVAVGMLGSRTEMDVSGRVSG